jgi:hypothetical protein
MTLRRSATNRRLVRDLDLRPELLVGASPVGNALESFTLVDGEIDVARGQNTNFVDFDDGGRLVVEPQQESVLSYLRKRVMRVRRVVSTETSGRRPLSAEDRRDEGASQFRSRITKLQRKRSGISPMPNDVSAAYRARAQTERRHANSGRVPSPNEGDRSQTNDPQAA